MTGPPDHYATGAPCWVSLMARDLDTAAAFYGPLLGWRFEPVDERWGRHLRAFRGDCEVAGLGDHARRWGQAVAWTTYLATDNADKTAAAIRERGGTVGVGPLELDSGRIALAVDPAGASFGLREGPPHPCTRRPATGRLDWIQLRTRDAFDSAIFYGGVFGWDAPEEPGRHEVVWEHDRVVLRIDGHAAAALSGGGTEAAIDPRIRPRWHVYFAVADVDARLDQARALGGEVVGDPEDTAYGRVVELRDPEGGLFSLIGSRIGGDH
ncbi:VOC family protein [Streptantibioticus silvisoli]|nr:VOC family protein [Streptantibioticus silvisoli]